MLPFNSLPSRQRQQEMFPSKRVPKVAVLHSSVSQEATGLRWLPSSQFFRHLTQEQVAHLLQSLSSPQDGCQYQI